MKGTYETYRDQLSNVINLVSSASGIKRYYLFNQFHQAFFDMEFYSDKAESRFSHVLFIDREDTKADSYLDEVLELCFSTGICKDSGLTFQDLMVMDPVTFRRVRNRYFDSVKEESSTMDEIKANLEHLKRLR